MFSIQEKKVTTIALREGEAHSLTWRVAPSLIHRMEWPHLDLCIWMLFYSVGTTVPSDIFMTVPLLHNPWKEAVANNLPSASFPTHGTDLGKDGVCLGLDILQRLMVLEEGLASRCATTFVLGWAR